MTFTLCTSAQIVNRAGAFASTAVTLSANWIQDIYDEAVGELVRFTNRDFDGAYASVNAYTKKVLQTAVSARAAFKVLDYDGSGFSTTSAYETKMDILDNDWNSALKILTQDSIVQQVREVTETS